MIGLATACLTFWLAAPPAVLDAGAIRDTVASFVERNAGGSGEQTRVELLHVPGALAVSSPEYLLEVEPIGSRRLRGAVSLMVDVVVAGKVEQRIPISATVRTFGTAVVAARPLERHTVINPGDVRLQQTETTMLSPGYCREMEEVVSRRTKRMFTEGGIIYRVMCEDVPLIRQGDIVTLVVRAGTVTLSGRATAKQDGKQGDLIAVQRVGSHDRIRSRVLDARTVEAETNQ